MASTRDIQTNGERSFRAPSGFRPSWFLAPGLQFPWSKDVEFGASWTAGRADILLPDDKVLRRSFTVPKVRQRELHVLLQTEVDLAYPGQSGHLVWGLEHCEARAEAMVCDIVLAHDRDLEALSTYENPVRTVSVMNGEGARTVLVDHRASADRSVRRWAAVSVICTLIVLVWMWQSSQARNIALQNEILAVGAAEVELIEALAELRAEISAVEETASLTVRGLSRLERDQLHLFYLRDLTTGFNDQTWLAEYRYDDGTLELAGFTDLAAASFLEIIADFEWVADVQLARPFVQDPITRANRFSILIDVVDGRS